jgi:hypothetical protein
MLIRLQNIAAVFKDKLRDGCNDARSIRAGDQENNLLLIGH